MIINFGIGSNLTPKGCYESEIQYHPFGILTLWTQFLSSFHPFGIELHKVSCEVNQNLANPSCIRSTK